MKSVIYKIKKEDTLESIAKIFGVQASQIIPQKFEFGDRVIVNIVKNKYYIAMPGDTFESIATKNNINIGTLKEQNKGDIFVGRQILI